MPPAIAPAAALPSPFQPFTIPWDAPQLSAADLDGFANAFEWWYFDLATDDGIELVVIFSRQNPIFATRKASVYLEYHDGTKVFKHIRNYSRDEFSWSESASVRELRIGGSIVRIVGADPEHMQYVVNIALPWLTGSLTMTPQHRGFLPTADGTYFRSRTDPRLSTSVSFSAPIMQTTGTLTVNGVASAVTGRGYHDHPWGTEQLFWTNFEWNWARTVTAAEGIMFADVTPTPEYEGALTFLYSGEVGTFEPQVTAELQVTGSDWRKDSLFGIKFPHTVGVKTPAIAGQAVSTGSMLDMPIYNRCSVTWTPQPTGPAGTGWVEYFHLSSWGRWLAFYGARIQSFFMRPFPWFGR